MGVYIVKRTTANDSEIYTVCSSLYKAIYAIFRNEKILAVSWDNGNVCIEKSKVSLNEWLNYIARLTGGAFDHSYPPIFIAQNCSYMIEQHFI